MGKVTAADWYRSGKRAGSSKYEGRKGLIARAARICFGRKGVAKTSIADITREVDITRELFYYYYPNKDAVVEAVLDGYVGEARFVLSQCVKATKDEPSALVLQIVRALRAWMTTDANAAVPMLDILRESGQWTYTLYRVAGEALDALRGTVLVPADALLLETDACGRKMALVGAMSAQLCSDILEDEDIAAGIAPLFYQVEES